MRGDMCPFDHGLDPVVVDDVSLGGVLTFPRGKVNCIVTRLMILH